MGSQSLDYGIIYHIFNRGNNKENLFKEVRNYEYFIQLLEKYITPVADILAFCLLPNHFHLLIQIKEKEMIDKDLQEPKRISRQFGTCFGTYAKAINKAYQRTGKLFENRFKRVVVATDQQYFELVNYIHQNPAKHGLVEDYREWPYSSYQEDEGSVIP
jgi:REP element-mobilizing transposase RayT